MSHFFTAIGFISFVIFAYTVYAQSLQIGALKKAVRRQRDLIESATTPLPQDPDRVKKISDETWADIEKLFRHNSTMK